MPAITLILNTNHTNKATVVTTIPSGAYLLTQARNKFRSKALSTVFRQGGVVLGLEDELPQDENKVWISKGEEYNGPPAREQLREPGDVAEVRTIASKSYVNDQAVKQLQQVAALPGVRVAVGMPDLHPGSRFPIGCALIADGVYPALIGSDIGCGIALYRLSALPSRLDPGKLAHRLVGLDEPWEGDVREWLRGYAVDRETEFDASSLGTVGGGNHFAEICRVEKVVYTQVAADLCISEDDIYLLVHSGSRGLGSSILASQTSSSSNPYLPPSSAALSAYLEEYDAALLWALANRDLIAQRIALCLGLPTPLEKIVEVYHNSVTPVRGEDGVSRWLHRKGAAPSDRGCVPCPGSRGDFSWLLRPRGDGRVNAYSLAHGAGRLHCRQDMHQSKPPKGSLLVTSLGSEVACEDPELLLEERPEAYKSVECVVGDLEDEGVAERVNAVSDMHESYFGDMQSIPL
ncbi:release factor H-coupled R [Dacryopinax primogenitus]|uniref:3'-phosphate/5'-hydroxy nucleic acid ligase n=1 Tax=Dacryopinax primogenitus (strain DJM 731) TaxID=1858805 RepID=M5FZV3_DACPD|nr:release factor H-coupled R [Dacryopinax primogenitus]EJU02044.1 release factor H-coupled R [Dacryopinax primogenitus]